MFDIKWIAANPEAFDTAMKKRGLGPQASRLLGIDEHRRSVVAQMNAAQEKRNASSKQIGQAKAQKDEVRAQQLLAEVAGLKTELANLEADEKRLTEQLRSALSELPNMPLADVPDGADENDNVPYFGPNESEATRPKKPELAFAPKEHYELGEAMGGMDFETAAKLSGSRFVVLKGEIARLERAIGQFMLDMQVNEHGYTEVHPPLLVRDDTMYGTGQLPKFDEDSFRVEFSRDQMLSLAMSEYNQDIESIFKAAVKKTVELNPHILSAGAETLDFVAEKIWELNSSVRAQIAAKAEANYAKMQRDNKRYLIPTAEVPLTNLVRESILSEDELPLRFTALTPCFRSEAGSAGRDTRGMLRQHQFNKVEMVSITTPQTSTDEHERMLACAEAVLKRLDIHYRVMTLCTGDMGFGAQKTYDIEAWLPGQNAYREISSVSVCGDFQARRMDARYRDADGKPQFVHTLNGSGLAVGRTLIAVLENYQNADGSVTIPSALVPYMGGIEKIGG